MALKSLKGMGSKNSGVTDTGSALSVATPLTASAGANYHDDAGWWRSASVVTSASLILSSGGNYITGSTF